MQAFFLCLSIQITIGISWNGEKAEDVTVVIQRGLNRLSQKIFFVDAAQLIDVSQDQGIRSIQGCVQTGLDAHPDRLDVDCFSGIFSRQPFSRWIGYTSDAEIEKIGAAHQGVHFFVEWIERDFAWVEWLRIGDFYRGLAGCGNLRPIGVLGKFRISFQGIGLEDFAHLFQGCARIRLANEGDYAGYVRCGEARARDHDIAWMSPVDALHVASSHTFNFFTRSIVVAITASDFAASDADDIGEYGRIALTTIVVFCCDEDNSGFASLATEIGELIAKSDIGSA